MIFQRLRGNRAANRLAVDARLLRTITEIALLVSLFAIGLRLRQPRR